ncbi:MAG: hypothetical protein OXE43_01290 [Chloroflexi bacterium]|nr:hypothetical protein [Chloroflexota bacterium]
MKVILLDDKPEQASRWESQIVKGFVDGGLDTPNIHVILKDDDELSGIVTMLHRRRQAAREGTEWPTGQFPLDGADVLVVDFDLLDFGDHGDTTGARLAYLARCYSSVSFIMVMNQFGTNRFDLNLSGRLDSFADLDIGSYQVGNAGLWSHSFPEYRPWAWPVVPEAVQTRKRLVRAVAKQLDKNVLQYLGFDESAASRFSDQVARYLGGRGEAGTITFRQVVEESPIGLAASDKVPDDLWAARIAVARVTKWLTNVVLPRQDTLVDAPHLVSRFPSLLTDPDALESWNRTASLAGHIQRLGIRNRRITNHHFTGWEWVGRHCWSWHSLSADSSIEEVDSPWSRRELDWTFAEDSSRFTLPGDSRRFVPATDSPFRLRYVEQPDKNVEYTPASRLD